MKTKRIGTIILTSLLGLTLVGCQEETHYISFYADGVLVEKVDVNEFSKAPTTVPEREGYNFVGWYVYEDGSKETFDETTLDKTKDTLVYADYSNQITVNYYLDGVLYETQDLEYGDYLFFMEDPVEEGYSFSGWYLDSNLTDKAYEEVKLTSDTNLYAQMVDLNQEFTVMLHYDDEVKEVETVDQMLVVEEPYKEGYVFTGWYLDSSYEELFDVETKVLADLELYGQFVLMVPEYKRLSAPTVTVDDINQTLTLSPVSGAVNYEITIYDSENEVVYGDTRSNNELTISFSRSAGTYYVETKSNGDGITTANSSIRRTTINYRQLPQVSDIEIDYETMTVSFTPLDEKYTGVTYFISINDGKDIELDECSYILSKYLSPGDVSVTITAEKTGFNSSSRTTTIDNFRLNVGDYTLDNNILNTETRIITYVVDDEVVHTASYEEGDEITPYYYQNGSLLVSKWYLDEDLTEQYAFNTNLDSNLTLYGDSVTIDTDYELYVDPSDLNITISRTTSFYVLITKRNTVYFSLPKPTPSGVTSSNAYWHLTIRDVYQNDVVKEISSIKNSSSYINNNFDGDTLLDSAGTLYLVSMTRYTSGGNGPYSRTMTITTNYEDNVGLAVFNYDSLIIEIDGVEEKVESRNYTIDTTGYNVGDIIVLRYKMFDSDANYITSMYSDEITLIFNGTEFELYENVTS